MTPPDPATPAETCKKRRPWKKNRRLQLSWLRVCCDIQDGGRAADGTYPIYSLRWATDEINGAKGKWVLMYWKDGYHACPEQNQRLIRRIKGMIDDIMRGRVKIAGKGKP